MFRPARVALLCSACAALAPACLLDASGQKTSGGGSPTGGTGGSGGTGGTGGGAGGTGGSPALCGDGKIDPSEQCDDGNTRIDDGCDADCHREPGWACAGEPSACMKTCGNGQLERGEECDDGGVDVGDGCTQGCQQEPGWECTGEPSTCAITCGDGLLSRNEECDDGNVDGGDGCSAACAPEHTCGNGIVDPTEECDGNPDNTAECQADCTLSPASVCAGAISIPPGTEDPMTGVVTSFYENIDNDGVDVPSTSVPPAPCDSSFYKPVLHRYTTGKRPSIVTVESLQDTEDGYSTFGEPLLWAYRDCPRKTDIEACDDGGAANGKQAKLTTGFLPAHTTLFIVLAGGSPMSKGPFRIQVTEQPVKLIYHEDFGAETSPGAHPLPPDLGQQVTGDGGWTACVDGAGSPCLAASPGSHSGGAFGWARSTAAQQTTARLETPALDLTGLEFAYGQYTFRFADGVLVSDSGKVEPLDGNDVAPGGQTYTTTSAGRTFVPLPISAAAGLRFTYQDGASAAAGTFSIDDIHVYGH